MQFLSVFVKVPGSGVKAMILFTMVPLSLCRGVLPLLSWSILKIVAHLGAWAFSVYLFCRAVFSDVILGRMSLPPFLELFRLSLLLCG